MAAPAHDLTWAFRSHWRSPFDTIAANQRRELLAECESKLPSDIRKVMRLRYRFGLTIVQIAAALQITEQAVDRTNQTALQCMRDQLAIEGVRRLSHIL